MTMGQYRFPVRGAAPQMLIVYDEETLRRLIDGLRPVDAPDIDVKPRPRRFPFIPRDPVRFGPKEPISPISAQVRSGLRGVAGVAALAVALDAVDYIDDLVAGRIKVLPTPGPGPGWYLRHGPNTYPAPYQHNYTRVFQTNQAWFENSPTGPQTGKLTNQAVHYDPAVPEPRPIDIRWGEWVSRPDGARAAVVKSWFRLPQGSLPLYPNPVAIYPPLPYFPEPAPGASPEGWMDPYAPGVEARSPQVDPAPHSPPANTIPPVEVHVPQPPGPQTKERKLKLLTKEAWFAKKMLDIMGHLSEERDALIGIWRAMPLEFKKYSYYKGRPIQPSFAKMAEQVYRHWQDIPVFNLLQGLANVAKLNLGDEFTGRLSTAKLGDNYVRLPGYKPGGQVQSHGFGEAVETPYVDFGDVLDMMGIGLYDTRAPGKGGGKKRVPHPRKPWTKGRK